MSASVIITMVNCRVIKAAINPLDSGEFPYDVMVWQRRPACPTAWAWPCRSMCPSGC